MPSAEILITFLITTSLFAYIPGPAMLYAAAQTLARGRNAGLMAALGIHLGCYLHVAATQRLVRRAGGAMLVGLGTHLALQRS